MLIYVKCQQTGKIIPLNGQPSDMTQDVKLQIQRTVGVRAEQQLFTSNGCVVEGGHTLEWPNITTDSTLTLYVLLPSTP